MNARDKFEAKIKSSPDPYDSNDCWRWGGSVNRLSGYGEYSHEGRNYLAHRYAYELYIGPIPPGWTVDHVAERGCHFRDCVNPRHLEACTSKENSRRSQTSWAKAWREKKCVNGLHDMPEPGPCKECNKARQKRWKEKHAKSKQNVG